MICFGVGVLMFFQAAVNIAVNLNLIPVTGLSLVILFLLIATATLVSEDLTCITVGVLVARGTIGFVPGTVACIVGIFAGDVLLYLAGRHVGRRVIALAPFRFFVRPRQLEAHAEWFERRGAVVVGVSRFLPGTRLATYLAAGILRARFLSFCLWLLAAAALIVLPSPSWPSSFRPQQTASPAVVTPQALRPPTEIAVKV